MRILAKEIIKESTLEELTNQEKPSLRLKVKISVGDRPFFTITKEYRAKYQLKEKELIIIKIIKNNITYELIGKIKEWGKINIPLEIIKLFGIKNHEKVIIEIIQNMPFILNNKKNSIDLKNIIQEKGIEVINRNNKFITIYKKQQKPITIPRWINKSKSLIESIYLIHGDGHYKTKLFFSNTNYELHNFIIEVFERELEVPKSLWKFRVNHSNPKFIEKSINFWSNVLKVKKDKFYKTRKLSRFNTKIYGDLKIIIDNLIVSELFRFLIKEIKLENKIESLVALNGILDAEGSAQLGKQGLHKVTISFNQNEKIMFRKLLEKSDLDIFEIEQNSRFCIRNWGKQYDFIKIFLVLDLFPFNKHIERKFNTIKGFLSHSYTKTSYKYLNALKDNFLSEKELAIKLGYRLDSVKDIIKKERYNKFITKEDNKLSLSNEGKEFIEIIKKLQFLSKDLEKDYNNYRSRIENFNQEVKNEQIAI